MTDNPFSKPAGGNRTIIQINPAGRPASAAPAADAMRKAGPDDGNRTIIRPSPGRRQPNAAPAAGAMHQEARREVPAAQSMAPAASTANISSGEDALTAAAAPLLQLMARLNNTANPPDSGD